MNEMIGEKKRSMIQSYIQTCVSIHTQVLDTSLRNGGGVEKGIEEGEREGEGEYDRGRRDDVRQL